jgi:hypothetical protein
VMTFVLQGQIDINKLVNSIHFIFVSFMCCFVLQELLEAPGGEEAVEDETLPGEHDDSEQAQPDDADAQEQKNEAVNYLSETEETSQINVASEAPADPTSKQAVQNQSDRQGTAPTKQATEMSDYSAKPSNSTIIRKFSVNAKRPSFTKPAAAKPAMQASMRSRKACDASSGKDPTDKPASKASATKDKLYFNKNMAGDMVNDASTSAANEALFAPPPCTKAEDQGKNMTDYTGKNVTDVTPASNKSGGSPKPQFKKPKSKAPAGPPDPGTFNVKKADVVKAKKDTNLNLKGSKDKNPRVKRSLSAYMYFCKEQRQLITGLFFTFPIISNLHGFSHIGYSYYKG